ncbi:MAG TPA: MFS transporter, partial [Pyrinomonadaceae bacterium]|nr:MFS transporter [Pyrinomonadaceae bacterium]
MASLTYMQLLGGNRSFRRLWTGQIVSELGSWFDFIAVLGLVRTVSMGAPEATATLVFMRLAPFALFAPLAGALVDRWSRRTVMIVSDVVRAIVVLGFLLVRGPEDLWIAYSCTIISSLMGALFEGAKNAAVPNLAGDSGLLAANALMFSSRFLLMSAGAALGGYTAARFGYTAAFVVDSLSFLVSAYSIWLIPEREMSREKNGLATGERAEQPKGRLRVFADVREGWTYIVRHRLVFAIIGINILWATGGGACNLVYERLGAVVFGGPGGARGDANVAVVYTVVGAGLFIGMMFARRVGVHVELHKLTAPFMGWMLIAHGLFFALAGLMPTLWLAVLMIFISRLLVAVEFAVQETLMMRMLPDGLRGRVSTTDRAAEIMVMSISLMGAGWSLRAISPR